jgi:hypothetical protein
VPVLILIAVVAVLAGVFLAATGRGGELAYERVDHAPLDLGPVSAPDIAMLHPPTAMWGYNVQVTDEALDLIARAMRDRDVTIAHLQQQLANRVSPDPGPPQVSQTAWNPPESGAPWAAANPPVAEAPWAATDPDAPQRPRPAQTPGVLVAPLPQRPPQPSPTLPGSYDVQGPQGEYDTHGWWAQQEEAAREEEARRQAAAQEAAQARPDEASAPEAGVPDASAPEAGAPDASAPDASAPEVSAPDVSASEAGAPSGRTGTLPNPVIASPGETATSSAHGDRPVASSAPPVPPDNDTLATTEEQGW